MPSQVHSPQDSAYYLESKMQEALELINALSEMQERLQEVSIKLDQLAFDAILHYEKLFT